MGTKAESKPTWRRILEVIGPVAVFAVATPFAVNGLADAVDSVGDASVASSTVSPEGVFSPEHVGLTADPPTS